MMPKKDAAFWAFHDANPMVFVEFERMADNIKRAGFRRYSARAIIYTVRYHIDVTTDGKQRDGFKINDHHAERYALLLEHRRPEFVGFFEHRHGITLTFPSAQQALF